MKCAAACRLDSFDIAIKDTPTRRRISKSPKRSPMFDRSSKVGQCPAIQTVRLPTPDFSPTHSSTPRFPPLICRVLHAIRRAFDAMSDKPSGERTGNGDTHAIEIVMTMSRDSCPSTGLRCLIGGQPWQAPERADLRYSVVLSLHQSGAPRWFAEKSPVQRNPNQPVISAARQGSCAMRSSRTWGASGFDRISN